MGLDNELPELIDQKYQVTGEEKESLMHKFFKEELKSDKAQIQNVIMGQFAHKRTREEAELDDVNNEYVDRRVIYN